MPMIELTYTAGGLSEPAKAALPDDLAAVVWRAERAPDTEHLRSITWTYLHEIDGQTMFVAGHPASGPTFRLEVTVPERALSGRREDQLVAEATSTILAAARLGPQEGTRVWVIIHEFADDNFARAGRTYGLSDLIRFATDGGSSAKPAAQTSPPESP